MDHVIESSESVKQIIHDLLKTNLVLVVVLILQHPFTSKFKHFFLLCQKKFIFISTFITVLWTILSSHYIFVYSISKSSDKFLLFFKLIIFDFVDTE